MGNSSQKLEKDVPLRKLEEALSQQGLEEEQVVFVIQQGEKFLDDPDILAEKLTINVPQAKNALNELKNHKINQISKEEIQRFEELVRESSTGSLKKIALRNDIKEDTVLAYLEYIEKNPITESQRLAIKEKFNGGVSMVEIAKELKISQKKVGEYVEMKFITFIGNEGQRILEIMNQNFERYPIMKLRELIVTKNVKLQEQICYQLLNVSAKDYTDLRHYFMKFEESQNFFQINETLSIDAKEHIRVCRFDDIEELSIKLNRVQKVIRDYLMQYYPEESLMLYQTEQQLKGIQTILETFRLNEQIPHAKYRMIISDSFSDLIRSATKRGKQPKMILNELLPLVFYYIKCSLPLEDILHIIIDSITNISLTTLDIFHLIFQMSDPIVRGLCIEHYSFSNSVPLYYPRLIQYENSYQFDICKELWYSLQQFNGLVSFGLGWASWNPIGKSHLLDLMFETDFVKGSPQNSAFHFGSIDLQMTKNLFGNKEKNIHEPTQWAYIDCHGYSDSNVIMGICRRNLDIALVHVTYLDFKENYPRLLQDLIKTTWNIQNVFLFVRDHPESAIKVGKELLKGKPCTIIFIPHLPKYPKNLRPRLKRLGYEIIHTTTRSIRLIDSIFLEHLLYEFDMGNYLEKDRGLIRMIMNCISTEDINEGDFSSLSYYPDFIEYMRCYYKASNETDLKAVDELNEKCVILDEKLKNTKMSEIAWYFNEIIAQENSTLILWKLAQEIKFRDEKCTLEILWREALLSSKYNHNIDDYESNKFAKEYSANFSNHIERGEPFELIDGDNLRFFNQDIDALLSNLYENGLKRPPIVISIFGPQSSGKSTLLNYCFGCKFLTSAGRCTKGVYASLSKLSQPIKHSDHFLILDTEGLDAIEKGNVLKETSCIHFDRTMVLFCLAVSQVVIINVKGEIGEELRNLLQICAYSLNKLKVSKVAAPKIFFVLNQQADPDPNKHLSSIKALLEDLNKESYLMETEGLAISDLIQISKENLFVLPSAFNSVSVNTQLSKLFDSDLSKLSPTDSFANKCADLRMSIIQQLKDDVTPADIHTQFSTMSEWLEMSGVIWDTIVKYQDIVKYRSVEELKCSISLGKIVSNLFKNKIYSNKEKYRDITEKLTKDIKNITSWSPLNLILEEVKKDLDEIFQKYQVEAFNGFAEQCQADPLLKRMNYMCDDAKSNLSRLIYIEKKIYEDKLRFELKIRLIDVKLSENMAKFQEDIETNADKYLDLNIKQQKKAFDKVWIDCFGSCTKEEEEAERDEMFDNLYSVFKMESKIMENKQTIHFMFRNLNFEMDEIILTLRQEMFTRFCDDPTAFAGTEHFLYPCKENKVPLKEMRPFTGKVDFEFLNKESLWLPLEDDYTCRDRKANLKFQNWVPINCHSLIKYCSGYYNHPDVIWKLEKRKQILLLASQLREPNNLERSTWDKFISDISERVEEFIKNDPNISHSTVKEIINFLCHICRVVNYEINYIEAKLTNTAERTISTYAFALAFKSILKTKTEKQRQNKTEEKNKREVNLEYFLRKVENRKMARGNWDRKEMRKSDQIIARKFAGDFLEVLYRDVYTTCEQNINEEYLNEKSVLLSHKCLLFLANKRIMNKLNRYRGYHTIAPDNFVCLFICNQNETMKQLFQEEWLKVAKELHGKIVENMKDLFTNQISILYSTLTELLDGMVAMCKCLQRPEEIGLDSDSNFLVADGKLIHSTGKFTGNLHPRIKEAPLKSLVLFFEMYLNPRVGPEEFNQFFNNSFEVDGVIMGKNHDLYVLYEKPYNLTHVLDEELFKKLIDTKMFSRNETIFNIKVYLEKYLRTLNSYKFQVTQTEYDSILKATKEKLESRVINCPNQCPSCGKFCEREIHPQDGKCQIMTGHQISSMGGKVWKIDNDKTAVLLMCEDYRDDMHVLIPGQNMKWSEFKENCGDQWDWNLPQDEEYVTLQSDNRKKMKNIWNKFGKSILQYYANRGTHITFIPYTTPEEIYESLFTPNSYVCFVIDGTERMRYSIKYAKQWISDLMIELRGDSNFKIIVYHGHCLSQKCVETFPSDSGFTQDEMNIQNFLENIRIYSDESNKYAMLHGLATATTKTDWKSGFQVQNKIVHIYVEPTQGCFNCLTATGQCNQGCSFHWKRDIKDKMQQFKIKYEHERLINSAHPEYGNPCWSSVSYEFPIVNLDLEKKCKHKPMVFINYRPDN